jgi:hypothetical protein
MSAEPSTLRGYAEELERVAERLRAGAAEGDEGAALVERCAELASLISAELDREARAVGAELPLDDTPDQERLL